jgi:putative chitinase
MEYLITEDQFAKMTPQVANSKRKEVYEPLMQACEKFNINNHWRFAAFLAQLLHESGNFHYVEEIASGKAYDARKDLGNLEKEALLAAGLHEQSAGVFYKGHGFIQITGYFNHRDCGTALALDLVNNPKLLCETQYACLSAAWFWFSHKLNQLADEKEFVKITKKINGGTNGLADRAKHYSLICSILKI